MTTPAPNHGRLLGLDHGSVRIGLALCDPDRTIASPLDVYTRKSPEQDAAYFKKLVKEEGFVGAVVGLPISLNGTEGPACKLCREFGEWFRTAVGIPVSYHDERFTTTAAEEMLWAAGLSHKQRQQRRDKLAAMLMLQAYLDMEKSAAHAEPHDRT